MKTNKELVRIYSEVMSLKDADVSDVESKTIYNTAQELEKLSKLCDEIAKTPHIDLEEKMRLNVA